MRVIRVSSRVSIHNAYNLAELQKFLTFGKVMVTIMILRSCLHPIKECRLILASGKSTFILKVGQKVSLVLGD